MKTANNSVETNSGPLEDLGRILEEGKGMYLKVGILGNYAGRTPDETGPKRKDSTVTNPEIGLDHEFGRPSMGRNHPALPERSWLRMPIFTKLPGEIERIGSAAQWTALLFARGIFGVLDVVGNAALGVIQDAFNTGGFGTWAALSPLTIRLKGHARILIETSQLQRSVTYAVVRSGSPREAVS